jgi:hypothetical protein
MGNAVSLSHYNISRFFHTFNIQLHVYTNRKILSFVSYFMSCSNSIIGCWKCWPWNKKMTMHIHVVSKWYLVCKTWKLFWILVNMGGKDWGTRCLKIQFEEIYIKTEDTQKPGVSRSSLLYNLTQLMNIKSSISVRWWHNIWEKLPGL